MEVYTSLFQEDLPNLYSLLQESEATNFQEDFPSFHSLFQEPEETDSGSRKRTKLDSENIHSPFMASNQEFVNNTSNIAMGDYIDLETPEMSPGSNDSFTFRTLAGSSGHIHFQKSEPGQNRFKRAKPEPQTPELVQNGTNRRLWVKNRSKAWWEEVNRPDYPECKFIQSFRMSRATFDLVCHELDSAVTKKNTMLRDAIPVRQRVAVCIYRLATGDPLRVVSKKFGLGISTCHKLVMEVCQAIKTVLMPKYLQWPGGDNISKVKKQFSTLSGLPDVVGAIYTTHIPIIAPKVSVSAYLNKKLTDRNQKTSYSITVQGVVDPNGVFTDVCIGWPGSMPDEKIVEKSALYQRAAKGGLKEGWIVGNSGYSLTDWMLTPYVQKNQTWAQHGFNEKIDTVQKVAKGAFGKLKGRWSCLRKRTEVKLQDLPVVIGACCVLHNICEMMGETVDRETMFEVFDDEIVAEGGAVRSIEAVQTRDKIAHHLLHHN